MFQPTLLSGARSSSSFFLNDDGMVKTREQVEDDGRDEKRKRFFMAPFTSQSPSKEMQSLVEGC